MHKTLYLSSILVIIFYLFNVANVSAADIKLLCLEKEQSVKFSACNPLIQDRKCNSSLGCQYCTTYDAARGVYCPASINTCNARPDISCSSLVDISPAPNPPPKNVNIEENPKINAGDGSQNRPAGNLKKADVAYIIKDSSGVDNYLLDELRNNGYTYEIIGESKVPLTNFNSYYIILVGNQRLNNPKSIPIDKFKSLIINSYNYFRKDSDPQFGLSRFSGSVSSPGKLSVQDKLHPIVNGIQGSFNAYSSANRNVRAYILKGEKPRNIGIIVSSASGTSEAVITTIFPGNSYLNGNVAKERSVFFGITETKYWNVETKKMFKNSLNWLIEGADVDGDGFLSDQDCNDRNPEINPASSDPVLNCKNDRPSIQPIEDLTFFKGDKIAIPIKANDPENDKLTYKVNDRRFIFSESDKTFYWQTTLNDGGEYKLNVEVSDGEFTASKEVNIIIKNNSPKLNNIPDISWDEDSSTTIDLKKYFSDIEGSPLSFGIAESSFNKNIQTTLVSPGVFKFTASQDWFGDDWIVFWANDSIDKTVSNKIVLKVLPINDPITLGKKIEDITWNEDNSPNKLLNLRDYFVDVDLDGEYSVSGNRDIVVGIENGIVGFSQPKDWNGAEIVKFNAREGNAKVESNNVKLTVNPMDEPPAFSELKCLKEINEDEKYNCNLEATDLENDVLTFSIGQEYNLDCNVNGNVVEYLSTKDYNGVARCELIVSDKDGSNKKFLEANVLPVNDAPRLKSSSQADGFVRAFSLQERSFDISVEDPEKDDVNVVWFLNNVEDATKGNSYKFKKGGGIYTLQARLSDGKAVNDYYWSIIVGLTNEMNCSEIGGNVCAANQICPSSTIQVKDTNMCCSVQCGQKPSDFRDVEICKVKNNNLKIEIEHPKSSEKVKLGDTIKTELSFDNVFNKDQNLDVDISLYDLTKNKSVAENTGSVDVSEGKRQTIRLDLTIPYDLDLDHPYELFVKAEDDICNQNHSKIELQRHSEKLIITEFELAKEAKCGGDIITQLGVKNIGASDQNVSITLKNNQLNINEEINGLDIEKFGKKDKMDKEFSIKIPENSKNGEYIVNLNVRGKEILSESRTIKIKGCDERDTTEKEKQTRVIETLQLNNGLEGNITEQSYAKASNTILIALMLLTTFVGLAFLFFCYIITRDKNNGQLKTTR